MFARVLDEVGGDPEAAPAAFTAARLRDVRAMQAIEHMQVRGGGRRGALGGGRSAGGAKGHTPQCAACTQPAACYRVAAAVTQPLHTSSPPLRNLPATPRVPLRARTPPPQILCSNAPGAAAPPLERLAARATMLGSAALSLGAHKLGLAAPPVYLLAGLRDARVPYAEVGAQCAGAGGPTARAHVGMGRVSVQRGLAGTPRPCVRPRAACHWRAGAADHAAAGGGDGRAAGRVLHRGVAPGRERGGGGGGGGGGVLENRGPAGTGGSTCGRAWLYLVPCVAMAGLGGRAACNCMHDGHMMRVRRCRRG